MLKDRLQIYDLSLVFIGQFNPSIIQPSWLSSKEFIREQEAMDAKVEIIHDEISRFNIGWANFEVTKKRFLIRTSQESYFEPIKDLAFNIFSVLNETPISALGINHIKHFSLRDENSFYQIGNILAPLSNWENIFNEPRLLNLEVVQQSRPGGKPGSIRIRIEPSDRITANRFSIAINLNDHYTVEPSSSNSCKQILDCLSSNWKSSFEFAERATLELDKLF